MSDKSQFENRELCAACGGLCCKICGCDYFTSDIEIFTIEYLESMLDTGRVCVSGNVLIKILQNGNLVVETILSLKEEMLEDLKLIYYR